MKKKIIRMILILVGHFSVPSFAIYECEKVLKPGSKISNVTVQYVENVEDASLLKTTAEQFLTQLSPFLPLPEDVFFVNDPQKFYYERGGIFVKLPVSTYLPDDKGNSVLVTKPVKQSLPLAMHELTHQILETYILQNYKNDPKVVWAFYVRIDPMGEKATLDYIEKTKAQAGLQKFSARQLRDRFAAFINLTEVLNEFLADTIPVLYFNDSDAIYNAFSFGESFLAAEDRVRRFNVPVSQDDLVKTKTTDAYANAFISKNFIWKEVASRYQNKQLKVSFGQLVQKLFEAIVTTSKQLTQNYEVKFSEGKEMERLNRVLISNICRELQIEPCIAPVLGKL